MVDIANSGRTSWLEADSKGNIEPGVSFLAVNKHGILALEELGKG